MIELRNKNTRELIGEIDEAQLQFLIDQLEEEDETDQDYYVNKDQLSRFEENGGDPALIKMLTDALGSNEDMDIVWTRS